MMIAALVLVGLLTGILVTLLVTGKLMKKPSTRIKLSHWLNWSNNQVPEGCIQLVRHGKWVGPMHDGEEP